MPTRFAILASGSKGNATVIQTNGTAILIDAGIGIMEMERRLETLDIRLADISALIVTHLHGDHLRESIIRACAKNNLPIYLHRRLGSLIGKKFSAYESVVQQNLSIEFDYAAFNIGEILIEPVLVPHDAAGATFAIIANCPDGQSHRRIVVATDFGAANRPIISKFADSDALIIEFNHDVEMLQNSNRSEYLKFRVNGDSGHLSNDQAASAIGKIIAGSSRPPSIVVAAHLSSECNTPGLVRQAAQAVLEENGLSGTHLHITSQDEPSGWFDLTSPYTCGQGKADRNVSNV